jgi:sodium/potassium/calcium exchanger 6
LSLVFIFLIFRFTGAVVEDYIATGIEYIAKALKMSDALAAVTLIALANGAGDVITAIVASGSDGGVSYNIGSLYGAGFFVCSV